MVYVDEAIWPFGRMLMAHLVADSLDELHAMADKIGVARKHFQNKRVPHYDVCKAKRALAIRYGAKPVDRREFVRITDPVFYAKLEQLRKERNART